MKRRINCALTLLFEVLAFGAGAQDLPHHDHEHDTLHVEEITISSNREQTLRRQAPALIDIATPRTMIATNAVCLAQTLDFMPGLRVEDNCQNCGFTQVRINGLDGHYSQILIDSKPIFSSLNGVYGLEQIPAEMIDRIEVMRGGGSALFGASAVAASSTSSPRRPQKTAAASDTPSAITTLHALSTTPRMRMPPLSHATAMRAFTCSRRTATATHTTATAMVTATSRSCETSPSG